MVCWCPPSPSTRRYSRERTCHADGAWEYTDAVTKHSDIGVIDKGWFPEVRRIASPNYNGRPRGVEVDLLVLHNISLPPGDYGGDDIVSLFTNCLDCTAHSFYAELKDLEVSAHFLIRRDGELIQFVSTEDRAWHAGVSSWCGRDNCNDFSVGIELEGCDHEPFEDAQYQSLAPLIQWLRQVHPGITKERVVGHSDIAPGRKTDPGPAFDWDRLRASV